MRPAPPVSSLTIIPTPSRSPSSWRSLFLFFLLFFFYSFRQTTQKKKNFPTKMGCGSSVPAEAAPSAPKPTAAKPAAAAPGPAPSKAAPAAKKAAVIQGASRLTHTFDIPQKPHHKSSAFLYLFISFFLPLPKAGALSTASVLVYEASIWRKRNKNKTQGWGWTRPARWILGSPPDCPRWSTERHRERRCDTLSCGRCGGMRAAAPRTRVFRGGVHMCVVFFFFFFFFLSDLAFFFVGS